MKYSKILFTFILLLTATFLSSCNSLPDIFDTGMGYGIITVLAILVVIVGIGMKLRKK
jgi:hypothetical protein